MHRVGIAGLLVVAMFLLLEACPPPPSGTPSKIAFSSDRDGNAEIYVMNADGSNQARLTNNPGYDERPTWSP